ncbi:hypothetical protein X893_3458 [Burkholderia pseudomallei TSV 31]|nr:hypothetical protein X893_3458 [Burkholderia pseudomallei TSV 31]
MPYHVESKRPRTYGFTQKSWMDSDFTHRFPDVVSQTGGVQFRKYGPAR